MPIRPLMRTTRTQEMSTDKYLRRGDVVFLDLGCMFEGYFSDFARTVVVGDEPRVPDLPTAYKVVHNSIYSAIEHMRPGVKGSTLDDIARSVIREAGYGSTRCRICSITESA